MSSKDMLYIVSAVHQAIHFDTLWQQAQSTLAQQAGGVWTDTSDHDPGVTLLQALTYGVSDLAYRHTLPLPDLLTPAPDQQSLDGLFPASFGPQQALTVSPITEDDYRRALLDLKGADGKLLFRNAQLRKELESERYAYYFDPSLREYHFTAGEGDLGLSVQGGYCLHVELNRSIRKDKAEPILLGFLRNHRNLCERVRSIDWLTKTWAVVDLILELEDDFQDYATLLAQIYQCMEHYFSPQATRNSAEQLRQAGLSNEVIYQGPMLQHGWITELPPAVDYDVDRVLNISPLAMPLQALTGVKSLQVLQFDNKTWEMPVTKKKYPVLFGDDIWPELLGGNVKLLKRGQQVIATKVDVEAAMREKALITEAPITLPYGRHRNPKRYYPASDKIPPCYSLQTSPAPDVAAPLHQYLLPFEQQLANGCDQLAQLPGLLSFERDLDTLTSIVWGNQWPFAGSVADEVHGAYRADLEAVSSTQTQSETQELAILNYLLGYFGQQRADRTLLKAPDYLASQRAYLSQNSQLNYQAGQFKVDAISAAQRRIAARLGFDQGVFDDNADVAKLPFYLVEHAALLPQIPNADYTDPQAITSIRTSQDGNHLLVTSTGLVTGVHPGQLLELQYTPTQVTTRVKTPKDAKATTVIISACVVTEVDTGAQIITIEISAQLRSYLNDLLSYPAGVKWCNSNMWLQDISFGLQYVEVDASDPPKSPLLTPVSGQKIVSVNNFPSELAEGDAIVLYRHLGPEKTSHRQEAAEGDLLARVVQIDGIRRQMLIEPDASVDARAVLPDSDVQHSYRWSMARSDDTADRYSFVVSAVFNDQMLLGPDSNVTDPYVTEAWVRQIVQQELPCHVLAELHWFSDSYFDIFAVTYTSWGRSGAAMGSDSFVLMEMLALGLLPSGLLGINAMRIATEPQRTEVVGEDGLQWNVGPIEDNSLLYVPPAQAKLREDA